MAGKADALVRAAGAGTSTMITSAVAQRGFTFLLNTALLHFVSAEVVGFASSDMELYLSTILFLSRESCRLVSSRAAPSVLRTGGASERREFVRLAWLPVPVGLLLSAVACWVYVSQSSLFGWAGGKGNGDAAQPLSEEAVSVLVYMLAAVTELLAEPWYVLANNMLLFGVRARAELLATTVKCVATVALAAGGGLTWLAFALGQLAFAVILLAVYARGVLVALANNVGAKAEAGAAAATDAASASTPVRLSDVLPSWPRGGKTAAAAGGGNIETLLGAGVPSLLGAFTLQSLIKHALTEGDRLLLTALASREQRGAYAVIVNYGSLPARFLFQPIEESLRNMVGKLMVVAAAAPATAQAAAAATANDTSADANDARPADASSQLRKRKGGASDAAAGVQQAAPAADDSATDAAAAASMSLELLTAGLRIVVFVGLVFACFGAPFAQLGALVGLGSKWALTELPSALAAYCLYIPFLAANGVTEAFATATGTASRLVTANVHMTVCFVAYAAISYFALPAYGARGIILANCFNMAARTVSSVLFIRRFSRSAAALPGAAEPAVPTTWSFALALPSRPVSVAFVLASCVTFASAAVWNAAFTSWALGFKAVLLARPTLIHIAAGGVAFLVVAAVVAKFERRRLVAAWRLLRGQRGEAKRYV